MHIGRHAYKTSNFTPGRCGVTVERISLGHERLCGQTQAAPTHEPVEHEPTKEELEYEEREYMDRTYMTEAERLGESR